MLYTEDEWWRYVYMYVTAVIIDQYVPSSLLAATKSYNWSFDCKSKL